ncbi:MAG: hypothetical protein ACE5IB_06435, partial [Candidatus Geothermarchaeales archaeon]
PRPEMQRLCIACVDAVGAFAEVAAERPVPAVDEDGSLEDVVPQDDVVLEDVDVPEAAAS